MPICARNSTGFKVGSPPSGRRFFPGPLHVYQWHYEGFSIPDGGELLATGETFPNQAFRVARRAFGLQFHPEATPQMRDQWLDAAGAALSKPGAHGRERQLGRMPNTSSSQWRTGCWASSIIICYPSADATDPHDMGLVYQILYTAPARRRRTATSGGGLHKWRQ